MAQDDRPSIVVQGFNGYLHIQTDAAKGFARGGGVWPKACQVSSLACKALCSSCLGSVVIVQNFSGPLGGEMTTTFVAHPEI